MNPPLPARLVLRDLACVRGQRLLFEGLSLTLEAGEAALVTGPNGVGKSSLLRLVAGLLPIVSGTIEREGRIAIANDAHALDPRKPLGAALRYWARIDGTTPQVDDAMAAMALAPIADVPVRMLSTGQARRAGLARVIASGAAIWLLDEPGNGLDTASLDGLATSMARHRARGGIIVAASHQPLGLDQTRTVTLA